MQRDKGKRKNLLILDPFSCLPLLGSLHKSFHLILNEITLLKDFWWLAKISKALTSRTVIANSGRSGSRTHAKLDDITLPFNRIGLPPKYERFVLLCILVFPT